MIQEYGGEALGSLSGGGVSSVNRQVPSFPQKFSGMLISLLSPLGSAGSVLHAVFDGADTLPCHVPISPVHLDIVENL